MYKEEFFSKKIILDNSEKIIVEGKAEYNNNKTERFKLNIKIVNSKTNKKLIVIMLNPSESSKYKNGIFIDQTITNLVKIANENGYNNLIVFNLLAEIEPKSEKVNYNPSEINIKNILTCIDNFSDDILIAWGSKYINSTKEPSIKKLLKTLNKNKQRVYTFCANKNQNYPKHPGRINLDCCRNCYGRKNKIDLKLYFN